MTEPLRPEDPTTLGDYTLTARLGEGGQGTVYLGTDPSGTPVAVKLLQARLSSSTRARSNFEKELAAAKRVDPFCTARILSADVVGQVPYIVSEFIPGPSLRDAVRDEGPRTGDALMRLAIGTATALTAIHQAGILHRDFKPANVIMGPDGARVIDFGIARAVDESSSVTSQIVGTPAYMAPEQLQPGRPLGPALDMFAWGATIAFAASGRPPFGNDSVGLVINRIVNGTPDLTGLSGPLLEVVRSCLDKDPARRPAARQVLLRLLGHDDQPAAMVAATPGSRTLPLPVIDEAPPGVEASPGREAPPGWEAPPVAEKRPGLASTVPPRPPGPPAQRPQRPRLRKFIAPAVCGLVVAVAATVLLVVRSGSSGSPHPSPSPSTAAPPAGLTWFYDLLGLKIPDGWRSVSVPDDGGTHVYRPDSYCDPTPLFDTECTGFWVMGPDQIAHADHGFGSYTGKGRYYPASDVQRCPGGKDMGYQNGATPNARKQVAIGAGHLADYVEWNVTCMDADMKRTINGFIQREWFLPSSNILIVDFTNVEGLPTMLSHARWR
jgi:serine/threonine protein kinase